jgi:hypothetical protein
MKKKRFIKQFTNFDDEGIECEILSTDNGSELCLTIENTHITLAFASTVDIVNWCNAIKELAIEKLNDEC